MKYKKCRNHVNNLFKEAKSRYFDKLDQIQQHIDMMIKLSFGKL